jgi:hypothetical protein
MWRVLGVEANLYFRRPLPLFNPTVHPELADNEFYVTGESYAVREQWEEDGNDGGVVVVVVVVVA